MEKSIDSYYAHNTTVDRLNQNCKDCFKKQPRPNRKSISIIRRAKKLKIPLTVELIKSLFIYKNNELYSIKKDKPCAQSGNRDKYQYNTISINERNYKQCKIIFALHYGYIPYLIDHIDRDILNDRIENLRECTKSENNLNKTKSINTKYKYKGIYTTNHNTFVARIQIDKKAIKVCGLKTIESAALEYNKLAIKYHREFASLNIINKLI